MKLINSANYYFCRQILIVRYSHLESVLRKKMMSCKGSSRRVFVRLILQMDCKSKKVLMTTEKFNVFLHSRFPDQSPSFFVKMENATSDSCERHRRNRDRKRIAWLTTAPTYSVSKTCKTLSYNMQSTLPKTRINRVIIQQSSSREIMKLQLYSDILQGIPFTLALN